MSSNKAIRPLLMENPFPTAVATSFCWLLVHVQHVISRSTYCKYLAQTNISNIQNQRCRLNRLPWCHHLILNPAYNSALISAEAVLLAFVHRSNQSWKQCRATIALQLWSSNLSDKIVLWRPGGRRPYTLPIGCLKWCKKPPWISHDKSKPTCRCSTKKEAAFVSWILLHFPSRKVRTSVVSCGSKCPTVTVHRNAKYDCCPIGSMYDIFTYTFGWFLW